MPPRSAAPPAESSSARRSSHIRRSANRDEGVFERPFEFDIARNPNKHLGFGAGVHFCLGSVLARLELRVVFEELLRSGLNFKLTGAPQWMPNNRLVGLNSLPVQVL